jgi:CHAT domain-containing protein
MASIKLRFLGEETTPADGSQPGDFLTPVKSYNIGTTSRSGGLNAVNITLGDNQVAEFIFEDGTTWLGDAATLEDLYPGVSFQKRSGDNTFQLPLSLVEGEERGLGNVLLKALNIFKRNPVTKKVIADLAKKADDRNTDGKRGLYIVDRSFQLQPFKKADTTKPILLFIHGTHSSTVGSFADMRNNADGLWNYLLQTYADNLLAFQHPTLTVSPLQNVVELVQQLPDGANLHLITQSRGGLIGDLLCRFCHSNGKEGFSDAEMNVFNKRDADKEAIKQIRQIIKKKNIVVKKFIRVACPAAGTHLASKRLDHYFNISLNLIGVATGMAANPAYQATKALLASVINCKNELDVLPGIEAMNPQSPFIKALNSSMQQSGSSSLQLDAPLTVISGNSKARLNLKGLLIIATKLFYREANDLIVHTESMYKGTARQKPVQYFFHEGADVDHFSYFKNEKTKEALKLVLESGDDALVPGFSQRAVSTGSETERQALLGLEGGSIKEDTVTGKKPILVLLPGIMGSVIEKEGKRYWINYLRFITGGLKDISIHESGIEATGLIKSSYKKFVDHFKEDYDVVTYAFDWRKPLYDSADGLKKKIEELLEYEQPIKIVGHSMGGVLVRDFIVKHPATWKTLNESNGFKMLFLGSPLGGSFRIPRVLFGEDSIIKQISKVDLKHSTEELIDIFREFPGILSLLPLNTDTENDFASKPLWRKLSAGVGLNWPVPEDAALKAFGIYRKQVSNTLTKDDYRNICYIAGKDKFTPCGYELTDTPLGKRLDFIGTAEGDQSVTWDTGIPPEMDPQSVYYVPVTHGALANKPELFKGISEIITTGRTRLFTNERPVVRSAEKRFRMPDVELYDQSPDAVEQAILGLGEEREEQSSQLPIKVIVSNGDLKYASGILIAGHFSDDGILYAEKVIDGYLNGALDNHNRIGGYPGAIGTSLILSSQKDHFKGAIIAGLGKYDDFTSYLLIKTIEQAASNYLQHLINEENFRIAGGNSNGKITISSLLIASGYGGLSIETSVSSFLQGIANANEKIRSVFNERAKQIDLVEFVELYEDKALSCFLALNKLQRNPNGNFSIKIEQQRIAVKPGMRRRRPEDKSDEWWTQINVNSFQELKDKNIKDEKSFSYKFNVSAAAARSEERMLYTSKAVLEQIIKDISENDNWTTSKAKTVFELLIPNDFKEQLKRQGNVKWVLDKYAAELPWELLQDDKTSKRPLCYQTGMIRQLATQERSNNIKEVAGYKALVIGDPDLSNWLPQLPGAKREAELVYNLLTAQGYQTEKVINGKASDIIEKLMSDEYKIIHLAGHGDFKESAPDESGMVIGRNTFLTTREINQMSASPELVVINCCYLGKTSGLEESLYRNRYKLAANIGTQLIENCVKAVIAAGWAVNDEAAFRFTEVFYKELFGGQEFGNAVKKARQQVFDQFPTSNTWGAYQCYGDPFYMPRTGLQPKEEEQDFIIAEEALIELENLRSKIEMGYQAASKDQNEKKRRNHLKWLEDISAKVDKAGLRNASITELEAFIYAELYELEKSCIVYESLFRMERANFSFAARERYCNVKIKQLMHAYRQEDISAASAISTMKKVAKDLEGLLQIGKTAERYNLLGGVWKSIAAITTTKTEKRSSWEKSFDAYKSGYAVNGPSSAVYPLTNMLQVLQVQVLNETNSRVKASKLALLKKYESDLDKLLVQPNMQLNADMDYWEYAGIANMQFTNWFIHAGAGRSLKLKPGVKSVDLNQVIDAYQRVWQMAGSPGKKRAEVDHLYFLIDAVGDTVPTLKKALLRFQNESEKY